MIFQLYYTGDELTKNTIFFFLRLNFDSRLDFIKILKFEEKVLESFRKNLLRIIIVIFSAQARF